MRKYKINGTVRVDGNEGTCPPRETLGSKLMAQPADR